MGSRPEKRPDGKQRLYIAAIAVLAAYRGLGLGSQLMQSVVDAAKTDETVTELYLHVHTSNTRAVTFYERLGFENVGVIAGYYAAAGLTPPDCVLLRMCLDGAEPTVDLAHGGMGAPARDDEDEATA